MLKKAESTIEQERKKAMNELKEDVYKRQQRGRVITESSVESEMTRVENK